MNRHDWPTDFDVRTDAIFQTRIHGFIEQQMERLTALDRQRAQWVKENLPPDYRLTYIFSDHAKRVADDMRRTAACMGMGEAVCENLYWAMLPHDIGKAALPVDIWDMVDKPEDDIKALRRSHTERGVEILDATLGDVLDHPFVVLMRDIMLNHHEQMDGNGFRRVPGEQLSLPVRLACIIESFDGYTIPRPHFGDRDTSTDGVLARMRDEKGAALYDMGLFEYFAKSKTRPTSETPVVPRAKQAPNRPQK